MVFILLSISLFGLFLYSYSKEKKRLINGFLFNLFVVSTVITLAALLLREENQFVFYLFVILAIVLFILLLFGVYVLIGFLFWNSKVMMDHEKVSLKNILTFLLAVALSLWRIALFFNPSRFVPEYLMLLLEIIPILMVYFSCSFLNYTSAAWVYSFNKPSMDQDYLIVLGSGLIDGNKVPPLLASRINCALDFYERQKALGKSPKILFSGGKGPDEKIAEGEAMQQYALERGFPEADTLIEKASVNTAENMRFSKDIIEGIEGDRPYHCLFVTNNFHVFRAGLYARMAGLPAEGIGSKTAKYFLPNAILREFIAITVMNKKRHMAFAAMVLTVLIILAVINYFFVG